MIYGLWILPNALSHVLGWRASECVKCMLSRSAFLCSLFNFQTFVFALSSWNLSPTWRPDYNENSNGNFYFKNSIWCHSKSSKIIMFGRFIKIDTNGLCFGWECAHVKAPIFFMSVCGFHSNSLCFASFVCASVVVIFFIRYLHQCQKL